jgi:type II secretory pathway component PulF
MTTLPHPADDASDLGGAIASLVASGLPIEQGLRAAARELPRGRTAAALDRLANQLEQGQVLEAALAADHRRLPAHLRALVVTGLRSASLGRVLAEFVAAERRAADIHRQIVLALSYPAFLLLLMSGLFVLFCVAVLPGMIEIYDDFDADLPAITVALTEVSRFGPWMMLGNLVVLAAAWLFIWLSMNIAELRAVLLAAPLLGPVIRWAALARYSRLLALLTEMQLPLPQALELAGLGCQDAGLSHASRNVAKRVEAGMALSQALVTTRPFPRSMGPMVCWGEQAALGGAPTAALADALRTAGEMFEGRLEAQLGLLRAIAPPLCFLFVVWGSLFLFSATMLPMVSLIERLT